MNRRTRLHPAAQQELEDAASFYDLEEPGLGSSFVDDFAKAGEQIRLLPESAPLVGKHVRFALPLMP